MENPMPNPIESVMAMFLMSMNTFSDYYAAFEKTNHEMVAKVRIREKCKTADSDLQSYKLERAQTDSVIEKMHFCSFASSCSW